MSIVPRGGWAGCKLLTTPAASDYVSLAIGHPSVHLEELAYGKPTQDVFDNVQKPLLLLPANVRTLPRNYLDTNSIDSIG